MKVHPIVMEQEPYITGNSKATCGTASGDRCQREFCFTWVSPNQCIIGLFQLFIGRLLKGSYPYIRVEV